MAGKSGVWVGVCGLLGVISLVTHPNPGSRSYQIDDHKNGIGRRGSSRLWKNRLPVVVIFIIVVLANARNSDKNENGNNARGKGVGMVPDPRTSSRYEGVN